MALSSKALAVPIVSTGAVADFPGSTAWGFFQGFGSGWMEVVSNCVRLKKIPQLLSLGSVPILRPLANVPEIQERWFHLGGTGWAFTCTGWGSGPCRPCNPARTGRPRVAWKLLQSPAGKKITKFSLDWLIIYQHLMGNLICESRSLDVIDFAPFLFLTTIYSLWLGISYKQTLAVLFFNHRIPVAL